MAENSSNGNKNRGAVMLSRVAILIYAAAAYLLAVANSAYFVGFLQNFHVPKGINARLLTLFCLSLPVIPIAIHAGWICHGRISDRSMQTGIFVLLALTSIFLLSQSMDEIIQYVSNLSLYSATSQDVRAS